MPTLAETMLANYETLLQTSAGMDSVSVDGQSVRYVDLEAKYRHWKRAVEGEPGCLCQSLARRFHAAGFTITVAGSVLHHRPACSGKSAPECRMSSARCAS